MLIVVKVGMTVRGAGTRVVLAEKRYSQSHLLGSVQMGSQVGEGLMMAQKVESISISFIAVNTSELLIQHQSCQL